MEISKKHTIKKNGKLIDIIRCYPNIERAILAKKLGVSLPTLASMINELKDNNVLLGESVGDIKIDKDSLVVNPYLGMFVGISIGASQIKISLVNFDFSVLSPNEFKKVTDDCNGFKDKFYSSKENSIAGYVCVKTPNNYDELVDVIDNIISNCIELDKRLQSKNSGVMGIGFAITGAIDNEEKRIIKSYNLDCFEDMTVSYDKLIFGNRLSYLNENNIELAFENIARAAIISEKYNLYDKHNINYRHKDKKNVACIYLGSGIGSGLILNNTLYRGTSNFSELGHIEVCDPEFLDAESVEKLHKDCELDSCCACGSKNCLEYKIRNNVLSTTLEKFKSVSASDLKKNIIDDEENKEMRLKLLGYYVGTTTNTLINILNLDLVIFTGKLTVLMDDLWKYLNQTIVSNKISYTTTDCSLVVSKYGPLAPSIGAAISAANTERDTEWY